MACQKCQTRLDSDSKDKVHQLTSFSKELIVDSPCDSLKTKLTSTRTLSPQKKVRRYYQVTDNDKNALDSRRPVPLPNHRVPGSEMKKGALTKVQPRADPAMSFVMLTELQNAPTQSPFRNCHPSQVRASKGVSNDLVNSCRSPSQQIEYQNRLYSIISSRSDIDHPICIQCRDILSSSIKTRVATAAKERNAYLSFLEYLSDKAPTPSEVSDVTSWLSSTRAAESNAVSLLLALEQEKSLLDTERAAAEAESLALDREEEIFWHSCNSTSSDLYSIEQNSEALNAAYDHDIRELDCLLRTSIMDDKVSCREQSKFSVRHLR